MKKYFLALPALLLPVAVFAANEPAIKTGQDVINAISNLADWAYAIFLTLAVIMIIMAAFKYLTGEGDSEKYNTAKRMIIYSAIAIAIAFLARGFAGIVTGVLR